MTLPWIAREFSSRAISNGFDAALSADFGLLKAEDGTSTGWNAAPVQVNNTQGGYAVLPVSRAWGLRGGPVLGGGRPAALGGRVAGQDHGPGDGV
jgi:hypothetical protein